jgi:hypothetical protein
MARHVRPAGAIVLGICLLFNFLYFLNIIPPVPLALKNVGIYHSLLTRAGGGYVALYEPSHWWEFWRDTSGIYTLSPGQSAFCFSSVFAPSNLEAPVYHRWEKQNSNDGAWETQSRLSFEISGGRNDGYRGFTAKSALTPGRWRCNVETGQGQLIGRVGFTVVTASTTPELSQKTL